MFSKGHRSSSDDVPKPLTANVSSNDFLSVAVSLIEPQRTVYECSGPLRDICKQKLAAKPICHRISLRLGAR